MIKKNIKEFGMTALLIENSLQELSRQYGINLGKEQKALKTSDEKQFYFQFPEKFRKEAAEMSQYYEAFYCLEKSIRYLISSRLFDEKGLTWWEETVPQIVKDEVKKRIENELQQGVTQRSENHVDYTTFGELAEIIKKNWSIFNDTFTDIRAVQRVMGTLNTLRGPIAHCCPLAPDEIKRLEVSVGDWFRIMK